MRMCRFCAAALVAAMCLPALAAAPAPARQDVPWLHGSDCLEPSSARGFVGLDDRHLLIDAGRNRYLIQVAPACRDLESASAVGFRGDPISGKVCGGIFDAVVIRGKTPCRIERMALLSKEQYKAAVDDREAWRREQGAKREAAKKKP